MDEIKIENFAREYPASPFPIFRTLTTQETELIRGSIAKRLGLCPSISSLDVVCTVFEKAIIIPDTSAEDDNFNLENLIRELDIKAQEKVFINWYRFDNIDEISLDDFSRYFDDLWYPAADAIDIFDDTLEWILYVDYSGSISVLKFQ